MTLFLSLFLMVAAILWLSVFGYILTLSLITFRRRRTVHDFTSLPEIAIVIPTLNEEELILKKLEDLWRTDYPHELMTVVVVDGGSVDRTVELVQGQISRGDSIRLVCTNDARGRTSQILHVFSLLKQDIVVVTDADTLIESSCIRELVAVLEQDHKTAVVGANVRPNSALLDERIHWWVLNYLWWLEGEILSSAGVSGVCYACRREVVLDLGQKAKEEDLRLPFAASAGGYRVCISPKAQVTEVRVPQSARELFRFRRRRGAAYLSELLSLRNAHAPAGWRIARFMRLWHFLIAPKAVILLCAFALILLFTPHWPWLPLTFTAFSLSALAVLLASIRMSDDKPPLWMLTIASSRLVVLNIVSMLTLRVNLLARTARRLE